MLQYKLVFNLYIRNRFVNELKNIPCVEGEGDSDKKSKIEEKKSQ